MSADAKPGHADSGPKEAWERDPVPPEWVDAGGDPLAAAMLAAHGEAIESARSFAGDLTFRVRREAIAEVGATLKEVHGFDLLVDICGADYSAQAGREPRFEVVYQLYSIPLKHRLRVKVRVGEAAEDCWVPSVAALWYAANWGEREAWDMYGVRFEGHPDPRRILMYEEFVGHPLRKDYPQNARQPLIRRPDAPSTDDQTTRLAESSHDRRVS